jgi:hypothetical protein
VSITSGGYVRTMPETKTWRFPIRRFISQIVAFDDRSMGR